MMNSDSHRRHDDNVEILVRMGFDRNAVKRALEVNGGNFEQTISDLTFGDEPDHGRASASDGGLESFPVPRREASTTRDDSGRDKSRKSKKRKKRKRRAEGNNTDGSHASPRTVNSSERFDVINETSVTQSPASASERRSAARRVDQADAPLIQNRISVQVDENVEDSFGFSEQQLSWPSTMNSGVQQTGTETAAREPSFGWNVPISTYREVHPSNGPSATEFQRSSDAGLDNSYGGDLGQEEYGPGPATVSAVAANELDEEIPYDIGNSNYVSSASARGDRRKLDLFWCKPRMSFGFLVLVGIVVVVPAMIFALAFVLPKILAPPPVFTPPEEKLRILLNEASLDGGVAMNTTSTPQNWAFKWLLDNENVRTYGDMQIKQRYALATLYFSTDGGSWLTSEGWMSDENECTGWFHRYTGEFCVSGAVVELPLSNNKLRGTLPDEITMLSDSLKALSLGSNGLSGKIPDSIGLLTNLVLLDLSRNGLNGTVPTQIVNLTKLQYLYLHDNILTGEYSCPSVNVTPFCYASCDDNDIKCREL